MTNRPFNPEMLRLARDRRGFTQDDLAKAARVTQALISKLEHGFVGSPSAEVEDRLAAELQCPAEFFHESGRALGFPHFHARERARVPNKILARISAIINVYRQQIVKLTRSFEVEASKPIPQFDLDVLGLTPEKVADRLRSYWMLPRGPVDSMVDLIENAGGVVILFRFGTALLSAVSFRSEGLPPLFFINKDLDGDLFRLSLAQELGHLVMHNIPSDDDKMADEAYRFAMSFLMPGADIKPYLVNPKLSSLGRVKAYWRVPIKSLVIRSHELKLITDPQLKVLKAQYAKAFRQGEDDVTPQEVPMKLREIVRYHRDRLGYSIEELAKLLVVNVQVVEAYFDRKPLRLVVSN